MRLIDADALIEDLKTEFRDMRKLLKDPESTELQRYMMRVRMGRTVSTVVYISTAPTVDAVPVIRCRDCKYKTEYGYCTYYVNFHHWTDDMDYCSDAERRDKRNG